MKTKITIALTVLLCLGQSCNTKTETKHEKMKTEKNDLEAIFPIGEKGSNEFFTGNAYPTGLVAADSIYNTLIGNVYFEPGARSNWHSHPSGQILIITDGIGYHQIEGKPLEIKKKAM